MIRSQIARWINNNSYGTIQKNKSRYIFQISGPTVALQSRYIFKISGSSVHGILQARILEWVAVSFSRGSSQPWDWTQVSFIADGFFTVWTQYISGSALLRTMILGKKKYHMIESGILLEEGWIILSFALLCPDIPRVGNYQEMYCYVSVFCSLFLSWHFLAQGTEITWIHKRMWIIWRVYVWTSHVDKETLQIHFQWCLEKRTHLFSKSTESHSSSEKWTCLNTMVFFFLMFSWNVIHPSQVAHTVCYLFCLLVASAQAKINSYWESKAKYWLAVPVPYDTSVTKIQ